MVLVLCIALSFLFVPVVSAQGAEPPIPIGNVDAARVIAFVATALALLFDYFPGLAAWFDKLSADVKRTVTVITAVLVVVIAFTLTCFGVVATNLACTQAGAWDVLTGIIYVIVVQYAVHNATKPSRAMKLKLGIHK